MSKKAVKKLEEMPDVMTVLDVAAVLRISRNTAYDLVHAEGFPRVVVGKQFRIPKAKFADWLNACGMVA